eukprot:gene7463-9557_t
MNGDAVVNNADIVGRPSFTTSKSVRTTAEPEYETVYLALLPDNVYSLTALTLAQCGAEALCYELCTEMLEAHARPTPLTVDGILLALSRNVGSYSAMVKFIDLFQRYAIPVTSVVLNSLLNACDKTRDYSTVLSLYQQRKGERSLTLDYIAVSVLIKACDRLHRPDVALEVLMQAVMRADKPTSRGTIMVANDEDGREGGAGLAVEGPLSSGENDAQFGLASGIRGSGARLSSGARTGSVGAVVLNALGKRTYVRRAHPATADSADSSRMIKGSAVKVQAAATKRRVGDKSGAVPGLHSSKGASSSVSRLVSGEVKAAIVDSRLVQRVFAVMVKSAAADLAIDLLCFMEQRWAHHIASKSPAWSTSSTLESGSPVSEDHDHDLTWLSLSGAPHFAANSDSRAGTVRPEPFTLTSSYLRYLRQRTASAQPAANAAKLMRTRYTAHEEDVLEGNIFRADP